MARIRIGVSGWNYDEWRGTFYPKELPRRRWLEHAAQQLNSIEHNGTFYSMQKPESYRHWRDQTSRDFCFALKGPRFITGMKKLKDVRVPLANFFASGPLELDRKLGPILWQLPAAFHCDRGRLKEFLELLPRDTHQAAELAREHDAHLKGEPSFGPGGEVGHKHRMRHAIEFRHESCFTDEVVALLQTHRVALVFSDSPGKWPYYEDVTAGFVYVRLHGHEQLYASNYNDAALRDWADRLRAWMAGEQPDDAITATDRKPPRRKQRDAYVYFDNTANGYAPANAMSLARMLEAP